MDAVDIFVVCLPTSTISGIEFRFDFLSSFLAAIARRYGTSTSRIVVLQSRTELVGECVLLPFVFYVVGNCSSPPRFRPFWLMLFV